MCSARVTMIGALLLAFTSGVSSAQDRQVHVNIGGGPTAVVGELADRFDAGWGPAVGVTFDATERVGVQFEYAFRSFAIPDEADFALGLLDASHQTHQLAFNVVANLTPPDSEIRAYLSTGPGMYYRKVEITRYVGSGVICDPYLYVCGTYPVEAVLGSRGGWDFGFNVGGGIAFSLGESAEFYIESRYHYVWGPEVVSPTPLLTGQNGGTTNGQYAPLTFGFRF